MDASSLQVLVLLLLGAGLIFLRRAPRRRKRHSDVQAKQDLTKTSALERAQRGSFSRQQLFNSSELKLYKLLVREAISAQSEFFVVGQTSMREMLKTDSKYKKGGSFYALGERRLDFVVIDHKSNVVVAVEYHGSGHYQGNAKERDEIKALALSKAGIPFLVVEQDESEASICARLSSYLGVDV